MFVRDKRQRDTVLQIEEQDGVLFLTFPSLKETGLVEHLFTTRLGGVSEGIFSTMNLSVTRGDDPEAVKENFRRIAGVLGCTIEDMVCTDQTHTVNIRRVTEQDCGKGVVRERDYRDVDGLVTDCPGIALAAFFADCVPLYFVDPVRGAVGLAHSGWRGTLEQMGAHMVRRMQQEFGSQPKDIIAAIGPSICVDCYEVTEELAEQFFEVFGESVLRPGKKAGKRQLDLWRANELVLLRAGISPEHISMTDICTCHNGELLFSHRASQGKRGNLGAFLMLKQAADAAE